MITRLMHPATRLRIARAYATVSFPPASGSLNAGSSEPPRRPPPRAPIEPTVFDGKASPREIHLRPSMRGMPPSDRKPKARAAPKKVEEGQSFTGPSRPRAVYTRPSRELPRVKVSQATTDCPLTPRRTGYPSVRKSSTAVSCRTNGDGRRSTLAGTNPTDVALAALGVGAWGLFVLYATNNERLSSSVVRQVTFQLRNSPDVQAMLGDHIRLADNWWGGYMTQIASVVRTADVSQVSASRGLMAA